MFAWGKSYSFSWLILLILISVEEIKSKYWKPGSDDLLIVCCFLPVQEYFSHIGSHIIISDEG